jgi:type VI secretion system secreted protein VgrG
MDPQVQGRYEGSVGGQEAKKAQGRPLTDPVERFATPLLHLDTPVSASFVTPTSIHLFSGQDTSLSAQGDLHSTSAHSFSAVSGQTTSLYTHSGGIKAITANAGLSLRAHTDAQQIWSEKDLTVQSTTDEIRIQASKSITLTAGQSQIVIEGGNITFTCPGTWTVKGASHDWSGGGSRAASMTALPDTRVNLMGQQFHLVHSGTEIPISFARYRIIASTGEIMEGISDEHGYTERVLLESNATLDIEILDSEQELVVGDKDV